jgi:hypothetical protein
VIGGWSLDQGAISGASCSGTGSWRATTLPDSSQRVIPRLGFWAISASYNRRATLCRLARFRSSAFDISEVVMFEPAAGLLEAKQS